jgi:hypothetical protein
MAYFLFTTPGETAILVSYKKEELETACFYNTHLSRTRNQSRPGRLFNQKSMEGHEQKRELLMKKQQPPPRFLDSEPAKERK